MPTPFAALETRINTVALNQLANASLTSGAYQVDGIFDDTYAEMLGIASRQFRFRLLDGLIPCLPEGTAIRVDYRGAQTDYTLREIERDGTGIMTLMLEAA